MATQTTHLPKSTLRERFDMGSGFLPYYLIVPTMLIILIIAVYPIIDAFRLSTLSDPLSPASSSFVGLRHYLEILSDPTFHSAIMTTVVFSVVSVALEAILGLGVALLINRSFRARALVRAAILIPWAFPTIVSAQIWLLMYNDQTGIVTYVLQKLHWLGQGDTLLRTTSGVILASIITDVWKTTPFMALLLLAGLQVIPAELYESASVDGSTPWQKFWNITLPLLRNSFLIALLFRGLDAIRVFDLFYLFTGGGRQVQTIASYAYYDMFQGASTDFPSGAAAAIVLFLFGVLISLVIVPLMRRGIGRD